MCPERDTLSWDALSEEAQLALSHAALGHAIEVMAAQAECLAVEIETGTLRDRGGSEALRLLVAVVRVTGRSTGTPAGHA